MTLQKAKAEDKAAHTMAQTLTATREPGKGLGRSYQAQALFSEHVHSIYHDPCISGLSDILPLFLIHCKMAIISYFSCPYPSLKLFFLSQVHRQLLKHILPNTITPNKINTPKNTKLPSLS